MPGKPFRKNLNIQALPTDRMTAALRRTDGDMVLVAKSLGCSPQTIRERVNKDPALVALLEQLRSK